MQIVRTLPLKSGDDLVTIRVGKNERLVSIQANAFYRLGDPHNEVVHADKLLNASRVSWCDLGQQWIDS